MIQAQAIYVTNPIEPRETRCLQDKDKSRFLEKYFIVYSGISSLAIPHHIAFETSLAVVRLRDVPMRKPCR